MSAIDDLNNKVTRIGNLPHDTLQAVSIFGYNETDEQLKNLRITDNNELVVTSSGTNIESRDGFAQVNLYSSGGTSVKADTTCAVQKDPEFREGWNCINNVTSSKFNFYIFNGTEETLLLGDISSIYFKGFINRFTGVQSVPFLQIYTKPTGSGDAGAFYHSRINYEYNNDNTIGLGEECIFYGENLPSTSFSNRKIQFNNKIVLGDGADSEEVLYIVCASSSTASINEMNSTINLIGFNDTNIKRNYYLVAEEKKATQVKQNDQLIEINELNNKIVRGNSTIPNGSLQSVLIYGKDNQGNLDPIDVDPQGHLKVTVQDEEKSVLTTSFFLDNVTLGGLSQSSDYINMNDKKNLQIVGKCTTAGAEIGLAYYDGSFSYYTDGVAANIFDDGSSKGFSLTVRDVGSTRVKIMNLTNTAINNLYVSHFRF